jgi:L-threonylcarbamoyladenylate synthase
MSFPEVLPNSPINMAAVALALQDGRLAAFPTETVYGLGADATNDAAVAAIFAAKGRPEFNPLIVHVAHADEAAGLVELTDAAERLMLRFWPGPLTLVLKRRANCPISLLCSAGLDTLAVRCPAHPLARELIEAVGVPIAAPSANRSGTVSPTTAQHVAESFREQCHPLFAYILAGGRCAVGLESTVLDLSGEVATILRPGAICREELEETINERVISADANAAIKAPGMLASHYAPRAPVRLDTRTPTAEEAYLAFGPSRGLTAKHILNLSELGDLEEAASNLFAYLRQLDALAPSAIAVAPIPNVGLGIAINDRLARAAVR